MAYIFVCSPTSGTASMLRILQTIAGPGVKFRPATAAASMEKAEGSMFLDRKNQHILYWFRGPRHWTQAVALEDFRVAMHFRDPRDLACNQYWWALQHPNTIDSPETAAVKRAKVEAEGIDRYALGRNNSANYDAMRHASEGACGDLVTWTSYTQLCCAFDYMTDNLCRMFNRAPSRVAEALQIERPENLAGNADWVKVGGTWKGADITPGRFRRDLRPETIEALNKKLGRDLAFCRSRDAAFLAHHYS